MKINDPIRDFEEIQSMVASAMQSKWVHCEVELAMTAPYLKGKVVPILIEETENWTSIHKHMGRLRLLSSCDSQEAGASDAFRS